MAFKTGDSVKVKNTDMVGTVQGATVDTDSQLLLRVSYIDGNNISQERFFKQEEIEAT
jgi:hypothetical protein